MITPPLLKLLRISHYIKNILIFFPAVLTFKLKDIPTVKTVALGFFIFCFSSSIVYIINDIKDRNLDKNHPIKCRRPIASGEIPLFEAYIIIALLFSGILALWYVGNFQIFFIILPVIYITLNLLYSYFLKKIPLIDVLALALNYIIRIFYGAALAGSDVSNWMFLTVMSAAFFMGFGKRRNELFKYGVSMRESLKGYTQNFLDKAIQISLTLSILFYSLMCSDSNTGVAIMGVNLVWTTPIIIVICFRYLMLLESEDSDGDPVSVIIGDNILSILCLGYLAAVTAIIYTRI